MSFKKAVLWFMTGILLSTMGSLIAIFLPDDGARLIVALIGQGLAILMMLIAVIGGWIGITKEKIGDKIEEKRKEKYYKMHPEERK